MKKQQNKLYKSKLVTAINTTIRSVKKLYEDKTKNLPLTSRKYKLTENKFLKEKTNLEKIKQEIKLNDYSNLNDDIINNVKVNRKSNRVTKNLEKLKNIFVDDKKFKKSYKPKQKSKINLHERKKTKDGLDFYREYTIVKLKDNKGFRTVATTRELDKTNIVNYKTELEKELRFQMNNNLKLNKSTSPQNVNLTTNDIYNIEIDKILEIYD